MSARLIAINVGVGDAFYLERLGQSVLVDGGKARGFHTAFERATGRKEVDVLVCTHNDSDHTTGILDFLRFGRARECWLPATWLEALARLTEPIDFDEWIDLLRDDADDSEAPSKVDRSEDLIDADALQDLLEDSVLSTLESEWPMPLLVRARIMAMSSGIPVLIRSKPGLLEDAHRILEIAAEACSRQIPIRWFDPEDNPTQSPQGKPLFVVNAREVRKFRRSKLSLRGVVNLTRVNRLSLVLYSKPDEEAPGVLFSADSDLAFASPLPASQGMVVTAPHHGSDDPRNLFAYGRLDRDHPTLSSSWTWVRSDKATKVGAPRPTVQYLQRTKRYCTRCRGCGGGAGQDVRLIQGSSNQDWDASNARHCRCTTP